MPNWNEADIVIKGSKESLDRLAETSFDFQKIRPMPQELDEDSSGKNLGGRNWNKDDDKGTLESWCQNCKTDEERAEMKKHYEEYLVDFDTVCRWIDEYGVNGWYDWSIKNWGTKWNSSDVTLIRRSDEKLYVSFTTAWSLPVEILKFIEHKYQVTISGSTLNEYDHVQREFSNL